MSILIKNVLLKDKQVDVLIEGNKFKQIADNIEVEGDDVTVIDGTDKAIIPSFVNSHTHVAMTLLRGYADDMKVMEWLQTKIWPLESKMTEEDIYWGAKLGCLEMIKSGTTFFNDMYWHYHGTARAVEEMGIRSAVSAVFIDMMDKEKAKDQIELNNKLFEETKKYSDLVSFALGPHAIYTVSKESLVWAKKFSDENNVPLHIHVSESEQEVNDCIEKNGCRPVEYLEKIGFLGERVIACHSIWLNDDEIEILKKHDVKIVHNPISNMKLASGVFNYKGIKEAGLNISLGTDGCASNNHLDIFEEMKFAALLHKLESNDPTIVPAQEAFDLATIKGAKAFGLNMGRIEEGMLADCLLIDLKNVHMNPRHHLVSNLVYSANSDVIDTTICDGKILMQNRKVKGEEEIIKKADEVAKKLASLGKD